MMIHDWALAHAKVSHSRGSDALDPVQSNEVAKRFEVGILQF